MITYPHLVKHENGALQLFTRVDSFICLWAHNLEPERWGGHFLDHPMHYLIALETDNFTNLHLWLDQNCPGWYTGHFCEPNRLEFFKLPFAEQQLRARVAQERYYPQGGVRHYLLISETHAVMAKMFHGAPAPQKMFIFFEGE